MHGLVLSLPVEGGGGVCVMPPFATRASGMCAPCGYCVQCHRCALGPSQSYTGRGQKPKQTDRTSRGPVRCARDLDPTLPTQHNRTFCVCLDDVLTRGSRGSKAPFHQSAVPVVASAMASLTCPRYAIACSCRQYDISYLRVFPFRPVAPISLVAVPCRTSATCRC